MTGIGSANHSQNGNTTVDIKQAGETKGIKKALPCDTLTAYPMIHQHKTKMY